MDIEKSSNQKDGTANFYDNSRLRSRTGTRDQYGRLSLTETRINFIRTFLSVLPLTVVLQDKWDSFLSWRIKNAVSLDILLLDQDTKVLRKLALSTQSYCAPNWICQLCKINFYHSFLVSFTKTVYFTPNHEVLLFSI